MKYLDKLEEAKIDKGKSYADKTRARAKRAFDADYEDKKTSGEGKAGKMMRSKSFRKTMVMADRARRKHGDPKQPLENQVEVEKKIKESYTMFGHILAETMFLETLETSGPKTKSKPNNFKLLKKLVKRGQDADAAGDKLDSKYLSKNTKTSRDSTDDRKQDTRLTRLSSTGKEAEKSFKQADKLVSKVHLKGGGKGDGKPRGKLRLAHTAYQRIGSILAEITYSKRDDSILTAREKIKHAEKMRAASSAAMKSRERDNRPHTQEQWVDALKSYKTLNDPKTKANADKPTTREQSS